MNLRCARCRTIIAVPAEILHDREGATVECPGCGARYRRRRKNTNQTSASTSDTSSPSSVHLTAATRTSASPSSPDASPAAAAPTPDVANPSVPPASTLPPPPPTNPAASAEQPTHALGASQATPSPPVSTDPPRAAAVAVRSFAVDQLVARRYRIVRFIAKGGMGEVYEAEDLELGELVALKTVRSRTAGHEIAIERLKREIQLARKVTHPNVCRIFDVGHHVGAAAGSADIVFLTMELLGGRTLAQRLRQDGPLSTGEALPLVRQMSAALAAAHRAGVVHRDLKSDNVMLVPGPEGTRAVITDFGVARGTTEERQGNAKATSAGDVVGTPAYMAPEQIAGGEITGAADVYALGVVMYEMVTGKVPFMADTPLGTAALRLTQPPPTPRIHAPDLDERWEQGILRCLEREPGDRFGGDAEEVSRFLGREDQASLEEAAAAQREAFEEEKLLAVERERQRTLEEETRKQEASEATQARSQRQRLVLVLVLLIAAGYLLYTRVVQQLNETPAFAGFPTGTIKARHAVAVLGFRNVSGQQEQDWLSTGLAEMLRTELARGGQLRLIPGENVARMKVELALADVDSLATDTLLRIRDNLGTDYVVLGSYVALPGGSLRLDVRLQDAGNGSTTLAVGEKGTEAELFDLISRTGEQLLAALEVSDDEKAERVASSLPTDPIAARLYSEGLDRLRRFDAQEARDLLLQAAAAEPDNALVHSALSSAYSALGYDGQSLDAAQTAFDLSANLPDEERLTVEGRYREAAQQWDRAAQIYESLWRAFPDNLEYGLRLGAAFTAAGRGEDALRTVEILRGLPSPAAEDPRVDLAEAAAAVTLAQFRRQEEAAAQAAAKARALDAVLVLAQAKVTQAEALRNLGRTEEARSAAKEARSIYEDIDNPAGKALAMAEEANVLYAAGELDAARVLYETTRRTCSASGDQGCVLRTINNLAVVLRNQGELEEAKQHYAELLALARDLHSDIAEVNALNNLGAVYYTEGKMKDARGYFEQALELGRDLGRRSLEALALSNVAAVLRAQGELVEAAELHQQALQIREEIGQVPGEISSHNALGNLALDRGDLDAAQRLFEEALAMATTAGSQSLRADALHNLAEVSKHRGLTAEARQRFEEAQQLRRQLGQRRGVAECSLSLAALAIDERAPELAASVAAELATAFAAERAVDDEAMAHLVVARASAEIGEHGAARQAIDRATTLAARSERVSIDLRVRMQQALVLAREGQLNEASSILRTAAELAETRGLAELGLESRLGLGELEVRAGNESAARSRLRALEREARDRGYALIALRAADAIPR